MLRCSWHGFAPRALTNLKEDDNIIHIDNNIETESKTVRLREST